MFNLIDTQSSLLLISFKMYFSCKYEAFCIVFCSPIVWIELSHPVISFVWFCPLKPHCHFSCFILISYEAFTLFFFMFHPLFYLDGVSAILPSSSSCDLITSLSSRANISPEPSFFLLHPSLNSTDKLFCRKSNLRKQFRFINAASRKSSNFCCSWFRLFCPKSRTSSFGSFFCPMSLAREIKSSPLIAILDKEISSKSGMPGWGSSRNVGTHPVSVLPGNKRCVSASHLPRTGIIFVLTSCGMKQLLKFSIYKCDFGPQLWMASTRWMPCLPMVFPERSRWVKNGHCLCEPTQLHRIQGRCCIWWGTALQEDDQAASTGSLVPGSLHWVRGSSHWSPVL